MLEEPNRADENELRGDADADADVVDGRLKEEAVAVLLEDY